MEPIPSDRSRALVIATAVVGGALATALVGGALWWFADSRKPQAPKQTDIMPAEQTQATTMPVVPTTEVTASATATQTTGAGAKPATGSEKVAVVTRIAYQKDGQIWLSDQDGANAVAVAPAAETYAVSPDGTELAVISDQPGLMSRVTIYKVGSGAMRSGGQLAFAESLSWSPDGRRIAYSSGSLTSSSVRVVGNNGSGDRELIAPGAMAAFSPNGRFVAVRQSAQLDVGDAVRVVDVSTGSSKAVVDGASSMSFAWAPSGELYFSRPSGSSNRWEIRKSKPPFTTSQKVGSLSLSAPAHALCDLFVSPDGRYVLTGARGDDGYCRVWVLDKKTSEFSRLTTRRDATPWGWTKAGRMLYFEGNQFQGEPTSLMSARPDGTGRKVLVEGATR